MRIFGLLPLLLLAALIAAASFVLLRGGTRETVAQGMLGELAPEAQLAGLDGGQVAVRGDFSGRAYVINLFASWCTPCRAEHPLLGELRAQGATILGVAYKDETQDAAAYLADLGDPYAAVALDPDGRYGLELGVTGVPETFVIGADGRIVAIVRGPLTRESIAREILPALGK